MVEAGLRTVGGGLQESGGSPEDLAVMLSRAREDADFIGVDLGPGYKAYAVSLVDGLGPEAQAIGTVDTISCRAGALVGWNTERNAFAIAISEAGIDLRGRQVLVIGSGAAARAVADVVKGAAESVVVAARRREAAEELWRGLQIGAGRGASLSEADSIVPRVDLIVNTTPGGVAGTPFALELLGGGHTVFDVVYDPPVTALVRGARSRGARAVNGLAMLLHRGMASFEIWTGEPAPEPQMRSALERAALEQMSR